MLGDGKADNARRCYPQISAFSMHSDQAQNLL